LAAGILDLTHGSIILLHIFFLNCLLTVFT